MTLSDKLKQALNKGGSSSNTTEQTEQPDYSFSGLLNKATEEGRQERQAIVEENERLRQERQAELLRQQQEAYNRERLSVLNNIAQNQKNNFSATGSAPYGSEYLVNADRAYLEERKRNATYSDPLRNSGAQTEASEQSMKSKLAAATDIVSTRPKVYNNMAAYNEAVDKYLKENGMTWEEYESLLMYYDEAYAKRRLAEAEESISKTKSEVNDRYAAQRKNKGYKENSNNLEKYRSQRAAAQQALNYHELKRKDAEVLSKYGVSPDNPDYAEKSVRLYNFERFHPMATKGESLLYKVAEGDPIYLPDETVANIRYIYNTQGLYAALEYAALYEEEEESGVYEQLARNISNMEKGLGRTLSQGAYGVGAGLSQWATGARNVIGAVTGNSYQDPMARGSTIIRENIDGWFGKGAYDLVVTAANMAPSIILAKGIGAGLGGGEAAMRTASKIGSAVMGVSAGGNAYAQAMSEGKPAFESIMYGIFTGTSEAALQNIIGGIAPLASSENVSSALLNKITSKLSTKAAKEGVSKIERVLSNVAKRAVIIGVPMIFEGGEEALQELLEPVFRNICFNEKNEFKYFTEEALYEGIIGALMGGLSSAGKVTKSDVKTGVGTLLMNHQNKINTQRFDTLNNIISGVEVTEKDIIQLARDTDFTNRLAEFAGVAINGKVDERVEGIKKAIETINQRGGKSYSEYVEEQSKAFEQTQNAERTVLDQVINGETKVTDKIVTEIKNNPELSARLAELSGTTIEGTNSERRAAIKAALKQLVNINTSSNIDNIINNEASQATETTTQRNAEGADNSTLNENVAQNGSQSVTEGDVQTRVKSQNGEYNFIADQATREAAFSRADNEVNVRNAEVKPDHSIDVKTYNGKTVNFKSLQGVADFLNDRLNYNFVGKKPLNKEVAGTYSQSENSIQAAYGDLTTIAHEVGHYLDRILGLSGKNGVAPKMNLGELDSAYGQYAKQAAANASDIPTELVAEFTRDYFRNYEQLKQDHPKLVEQFEKALKESPRNLATVNGVILDAGLLYDTIRTAADMSNGYMSLTPEERLSSYIITAEQQKRIMQNASIKSMRERVNGFIYKFFDSYFPIKIGGNKAYVLATLQTNLGMNIESAVIYGVYANSSFYADVNTGTRPEVDFKRRNEKRAEGWGKAFEVATEGITDKKTLKAVKDEFQTYLMYKDMLDSMTMSDRADEAEKVAKTLEYVAKGKDRERVAQVKKSIDNALLTTSNDKYKAIRDSLNKAIKNTKDKSTKKALKSLYDALPEYSKKRTVVYTISTDNVVKIARELSDIVKETGADNLESLREYVAASTGGNETLGTLLGTLNDLMTQTNVEAVKELNQKVFNSDSKLNDPKYVKNEIARFEYENPNFVEAAKIIRTWYEAIQDMMVASGIWTQQDVDNLRKKHPNYIGLHRAVEQTEAQSSKNKLGRRETSTNFGLDNPKDMLSYERKGSDLQTYTALEQATYFAANVMRQVSANNIRKQLYNEARNDVTGLVSDMSDEEYEAFQNVAESTVFKRKGMTGNEYSAVTYYDNGQQYHYYVNDPLIGQALAWEQPTPGKILGVVRPITQFTKKFATQLNPAFIVRNVVRDMQQAFRNGTEANPFKFGTQWAEALFQVMTNSEDYKRAVAEGLEGATLWKSNLSKAVADIKSAKGIDLATESALRAAMSGAAEVIDLPFKPIKYGANVTEATTRFAEYLRQLRNGATPEEATLAAQEVTTFFGRKGASKLYYWADSWIPFLGANIQGAYNNLRQFVKYDPKSGKFSFSDKFASHLTKTAVVWAIPTIAQYAILLAGSDDEKEKKLEAFRAETNYVKNMYWLVWVGDDTFVKIPKSQMLSPILSGIERTFDKLALDDPLAFETFINYAVNQLIIGNFNDMTNVTGIGTLWALGTNKDWRGVPIDEAEEYGENTSGYLHYDENTSAIAKWAANTRLGRAIDASPQKIDYVISDIAPFIGSLMKDLTSEKGNAELKDNLGIGILSALGLKSGTTADSVYSTDIKREYYNYKKAVNKVATDARNLFTPETSAAETKRYGEGMAQNANYSSFDSQIRKNISQAISRMNDATEKRSANKTLNQLMTGLSNRHGETSKGGTQLDKDIAAMYSDYNLFMDTIDKGLGYWLSEANQKDANGKTVKNSKLSVSKVLIVDKTADRIQKAINSSDKTLTQLAEETGIPYDTLLAASYGNVDSILNSDYRFSRLAKAVGTTTDDLLGKNSNDAIRTVNYVAAYYAMVDEALNQAWDEYVKEPRYKTATIGDKYEEYVRLRNAVCHAALAKISEIRAKDEVQYGE